MIIQRRGYNNLSEQFGQHCMGRRFVHLHCFTFPNIKVFAMTRAGLDYIAERAMIVQCS